MAVGAASAQYGDEALLGTRARFHLVYRLTSRFLQFAPQDGGAHRSTGWQIALIGFVCLDVITWALLRNTERFWLKGRVTLDTVDIAVWSLAPYPPGIGYDVAVVVGMPLAMEAGLRLRWRGLIVAGSALTGTAAVRLLWGRPVLPFSFLWLVAGVAGGVLVARYDRRLRRQVEHEWLQHRSAEEERAFLAGQNAVAMGASSVVDGLEAVLPVLGRPSPGSALADLSDAWKARLGHSTAQRSTYLGIALQRWAADHNQHPDLSGYVQLNPHEGIGTTLLTGTQAQALSDGLSGLPLRGRIVVALEDAGIVDHPPGGRVRLLVGEHVVELPPDGARAPRPCDPAPLAFLIGAIGMARGSASIVEHVPVLIAASASMLTLLAAYWAHLRLRRLGPPTRALILWVAIAVAAMHTIVATLTMRHAVNAAGVEIYPGITGLLILGMLGGLYFQTSRARERWMIGVGALLVCALGWMLHPVARQPFSLAATLAWPSALYLTGIGLGRELQHAEDRYGRDLRADDAQAVDEAFRGGRSAVLELVSRARDDAWDQLTRSRATLEPALYAGAECRLLHVDRRLATIVGASSSSTTTSSLAPDSPPS